MAGTKNGSGKRWGLTVIVVVVLLLCGFIYWKTMSLKDEVEALNEKYESLQEDIEAAKRETIATENKIKYYQTDDYIEDQARDIFGLRDSDETIFKPEEEKTSDKKKNE